MADIEVEEPLGYSSENLRDVIFSNLKRGNFMGNSVTEEQVDKFVDELPELSDHISTLFDRIVDLVSEYPEEILHAAGVTVTAGFGYYAMNPELVGALFIGTRSCHMQTLYNLDKQIEQKEKSTGEPEADVPTTVPPEKEVAYVPTDVPPDASTEVPTDVPTDKAPSPEPSN